MSGAPLLTRTRARGLATLGAGLALVLAMYTAGVESMPEFHAYDGWWMLLGAAATVAVISRLVWRCLRSSASSSSAIFLSDSPVFRRSCSIWA